MDLQDIITQARRSYSIRGHAGVRETFHGLDKIEQAVAMNFSRSYSTSPADSRDKRFADAFLQFETDPVRGHKDLTT